jgi:hypothetical protein
MHLFCVALFVMVFPGVDRPYVEVYATVLPGVCPDLPIQDRLAASLREATEAAHVQYQFKGLAVQTQPEKDI